jgi:hypothetical protein
MRLLELFQPLAPVPMLYSSHKVSRHVIPQAGHPIEKMRMGFVRTPVHPVDGYQQRLGVLPGRRRP